MGKTEEGGVDEIELVEIFLEQNYDGYWPLDDEPCPESDYQIRIKVPKEFSDRLTAIHSEFWAIQDEVAKFMHDQGYRRRITTIGSSA